MPETRKVARFLRKGSLRRSLLFFSRKSKEPDDRRPDFVLPNVVELSKGAARPFDAAIVLSLKTTLRERWKQVSMEKFNSALFLGTVDDRVTAAAIADMGRQGICLVVPESLKRSKETCYPDSGNVISFRDFFDEEVARRRPSLLLPLAG